MDKSERTWLVYLIRCRDGSYYCGATNDIRRRTDQHNRGVAARYTKGRGPVKLMAKSGRMTRGAALSLEAKVKKTRRNKKAIMVKGS